MREWAKTEGHAESMSSHSSRAFRGTNHHIARFPPNDATSLLPQQQHIIVSRRHQFRMGKDLLFAPRRCIVVLRASSGPRMKTLWCTRWRENEEGFEQCKLKHHAALEVVSLLLAHNLWHSRFCSPTVLSLLKHALFDANVVLRTAKQSISGEFWLDTTAPLTVKELLI